MLYVLFSKLHNGLALAVQCYLVTYGWEGIILSNAEDFHLGPGVQRIESTIFQMHIQQMNVNINCTIHVYLQWTVIFLG